MEDAMVDQTPSPSEPSWVYALVIGFLGIALLILVVAIVVGALSGGRPVDASIISAATLIAGGLIGILAPSPRKPG